MTKCFRNWDKDFLARQSREVKAQFPFSLSKELGITAELMHDLLTGIRNCISSAGLASQYNEAMRRNHLEAEKLYLLWLYRKKGTLTAAELAKVCG